VRAPIQSVQSAHRGRREVVIDGRRVETDLEPLFTNDRDKSLFASCEPRLFRHGWWGEVTPSPYAAHHAKQVGRNTGARTVKTKRQAIREAFARGRERRIAIMPKKQQFVAAVVEPTVEPPTETWRVFFAGLLRRCGRALAEWCCHSLLLFLVFAVIQALHYGMTHVLGVPVDKKFFGVVPLAWLVDGADLFLIIGIGIVGVVAAIRSYMGKH
jgi:hypothetical protein